jgi:hypothetical protein
MQGLTALTTTDYGRTLLGKLLVLVPILALAFLNRRHATSSMTDLEWPSGEGGWARRMGGTLAAETVLLVCIIGVVAWLTSLPPAAAATRGQFQETAVHGNIAVTLTIHPGQVGLNHVTVFPRNAANHRVVRVRAVTVFVKSLDTSSALQTLDGMAASDGTFAAVLVIPDSGRATVSVQVTPESGDVFVVEFEPYFTR